MGKNPTIITATIHARFWSLVCCSNQSAARSATRSGGASSLSGLGAFLCAPEKREAP
jgi:hypothetical protein